MTKYTIKPTTQFKKDYKLAKKRHLDIELLKEILKTTKITPKEETNKYLEELGIDGIAWSMKPSIRGLMIAKSKYKLKKKEMCIIGDQIVTDILAGNRFHIKTILVDPLGEKDLKITGLNRKIEGIIVKKYEKRGLFERGKYYG